ncbi:MAG: hypothetical protein WD696_19380 [Bryobacteraceae bacterium]
MACRLCETRKPRRFCPGVGGDICSLCCGMEREVTVDCPLDCEYLVEAHVHERTPPVEPDKFPNRDVPVTTEFIRANGETLQFLGTVVMAAALESGSAVDFDIRDALESLVKTYKTLQTGLYYESRPNGPVAAHIFGRVQQAVEQMRIDERQRHGMSRLRDSDVLGVLAFLQRLEIDRNNGRRRGRAFLDFLRQQLEGATEPAPNQAPSLIVP